MNTTKNTNWIHRATGAAFLLGICSLPAGAATITVPDGNFTSLTNSGSTGGGLINPNGTNQAIGTSGPWVGTYTGLLLLLAPPKLTIAGNAGGGSATISGVVQELNAVLDNTGYFSQTLTGTNYLADTVYTLDANVDVGQLIGASVLGSDGVGIGLTNGSSVLADTTTPADVLSLTLLGNTTYRLDLQFTTGAIAPTGNVGIRLFDTPNSLASANLLSSATFSNVTLDASPASAPEPASFAMMFGGVAGIWFGRKRLMGRK